MSEVIRCALVCLRSGRVLEQLDGPAIPHIEELASAASALFCGLAPPALMQAFARMGSDGAQFQELSFASAQGAHALLRADTDVAVVAVCSDAQKLGAVLSAAHARRSALERVR